MLNAVIKYLNNYFFEYTYTVPKYQFTVDCTFTASDTITGDFTDTFIVGEYILVKGTRVNDGIYKVTANGGTSLTVDATLDITISTESTEVETTLTKMYIPDELIELIAEIKTYNTNTTDGIVSESQGERSVTYGTSSGGGSTGWKSAFSDRLSTYRKLRWC